MKRLISLFCALFVASHVQADEPLHVVYPGGEGPGKGKHVVLISGDEEYRSEEFMPALGRILADHHGFKCTVLFSVDEEGFINPNNQQSMTHPESLDSADAIITAIRFRKYPDEVMEKFDAAMKRGVPVVGLRTSTHAFQHKNGEYKSYNQWGKEVLGEKWVSHWGKHKKEATRGVIEEANADHPVLNGVEDVFGNTDVYEASPPEDATILLRGQVLKGMEPDSEPADYKKKGNRAINDPMMPILWTRELPREGGEPQRIVTCTMGAPTDFQSEDLRRAVVNGVFWGLGMEVPEKAKVDFVGELKPLMYGFNDFRKGVKPSDHAAK
ncbi:MAG: ThuA domain-containing protein [Akkermansiaceae bacterium]|nr:ThuA domain-containing protein [Akkermansiaceae bacterium]